MLTVQTCTSKWNLRLIVYDRKPQSIFLLLCLMHYYPILKPDTPRPTMNNLQNNINTENNVK